MLQDMASWSRDGIAGLQSVVLYSLPELDGAIDTVPLGGLVGDNIFLVSERVTRLSQRIKKWVHLRRSQTQVGMFCFWLPFWLAALPCPALPCPVCLLHCHALPFPSLPCPTLPCPASVFAALLCPALLCHARPCSALPCPAPPCPVLPCPGKFLMPVTGSVQLFDLAVCLPTRAVVIDMSIIRSMAVATYSHQPCTCTKFVTHRIQRLPCCCVAAFSVYT